MFFLFHINNNKNVEYFQIYLLPKSILLHIGFGAAFFLLAMATWAWENVSLLKLGYDKYKRRISLKSD